MEFSIVFWNTWLNNQLGGQKSAKHLIAGLDRLVAEHAPGCFGLSEVLSDRTTGSSFLLEHLKSKGYRYLHHAVSGAWTSKWDIGVGIASRYPLEAVTDINLGGHLTSKGMERSGTSSSKALYATLRLSEDVSVEVIVAHLMHLRISHLDVHFQHRKNLTRFINETAQSPNLIIGGDFNEPTIMPGSFTALKSHRFKARTGTLANPTWLSRANRQSLLRGNPDKILWSRSNSLELTKFQVVPETASDHRPLYARFSILNETKA